MMKKFIFVRNNKIRGKEELQGICSQFHFKHAYGEETPKIFFATKHKVVEYDIHSEEVTTILSLNFELGYQLSFQPNIFEMNDAQTCSIIANSYESAFFNHKTGLRRYIGEVFSISLIREIVYDNDWKQFYVMANKYKGKLGLYVIRFHEDEPDDFEFLLKFKNKLEVSDAHIIVHRCPIKNYKELILSYKSIYVNTYSVAVFDISDPRFFTTVFRHDSF